MQTIPTIDDNEFNTLKNYATNYTDDKNAVALINKIIQFKEQSLKPGIENLQKLSPTKPTDKQRMLRQLQGLLSTLTILQDDIRNITVSDEVNDEIQIVLSYVRKILEQTKEQLNYPTDKITSQQLHIQQEQLYEDSEAQQYYLDTLAAIQKFYQDKGYTQRTCFISYAWPLPKDEKNSISLLQQDESWLQTFLKGLRTDLRKVGIHAYLDIADNEAGNNIYQFMEKGSTCDIVLLIGTESLLKKHKRGLSAVCTELIEIKRKRQQDKELSHPPRVYPLLLSGSVERSFPAEFELYSTIREWQKKTYVTNIKELIRTCYRASQDNADYQQLWADFKQHYAHYLIQQDTAPSITKSNLVSLNSAASSSTSPANSTHCLFAKTSTERSAASPNEQLVNTSPEALSPS